MAVSLLVTVFDEVQTISVHDDTAAAWSSLVAFVEMHWYRQMHTEAIPNREDERVRLFFADPNATYLIAEADIAEVEAVPERSTGATCGKDGWGTS
jgi:hypothetical protein